MSGSLQAPASPLDPAADTGEDLQWRYRAVHLAYTQCTERDAVAHLATFYDAVVRHYSSLSPATLPLRLYRPLLLEVQPLVKEASVGTCASARPGGGAGGGGGFGGGQLRQQCQQETVTGGVEAASLVACKPVTKHALPSTCTAVPSLHRGAASRHSSPLPRPKPPLLRSLAPPCLLCVEERHRAAPHSSSFPPTIAPLQTLHMDVWGLARVRGHHERYFLLVVDDYTRYTTEFPLQSKADVYGVLIPCIRTVRCQLSARFQRDLLVLRLHSDRGGEFSSRILEDSLCEKGIVQSFTISASPPHNGIAERCIGLIMEGPAPSGVSQVDPPPLVELLGVSSDTSGPTEEGDPAAEDTAATRRSPRLETPPGFLPRPSLPPLQHVAVDFGAAGGGDTGGADSGVAGSGGADSVGSGRTSGGGVVGATAGQQQESRRQDPLLPQHLRKWAVQWGSPGGGAWGAGGGGARGARAGGAGGTGAVGAGAGGAGAGGAGARGSGAGGAGAGCAGAGGAGFGGAGAGGAGAGGAGAGGAGGGGLELREWAVWWGSPGGGAGAAGARGIGTTAAGGAGAGGPVGPITGCYGGVTTQQHLSALRHLLSLPPAVTEFPVAGTTPYCFHQLTSLSYYFCLTSHCLLQLLTLR
ncbi:unnamed protein product [Closterium sp. NIES-54]